MNFDELKPGPELDRLIVERVMGWKKTTNRPQDYSNWKSYPDEWFEIPDKSIVNVTNVPHFSSDIACAWQIVDKLQSEGHRVAIHVYEDGFHYCTIDQNPVHEDEYLAEHEATTVPLAICIAALKAVKNETG